MNKENKNEFYNCLNHDNILINEHMSKHTTFKIGGYAKYFLYPNNINELMKILYVCKKKKINFFVIGNGSNLLVSDYGYNGAIICFNKNMCNIKIYNNFIKVQSGIILSKISNTAYKYKLSGIEFANLIPGTIGGAIAMNAGAYNYEIKDIVYYAIVLNIENFNILCLKNNELKFKYRKSILNKKKYIALEVVMKFKKNNKYYIKKQIINFNKYRFNTQPLNVCSAGSIFKNINNYSISKLIINSGLCGFKVGNAQISKKHCGFIINNGSASANDIIKLINKIKNIIMKNFNIIIKPEIKFLGKF